MKSSPQKVISFGIAAAGIVILVTAGAPFLIEICSLKLASNLILTNTLGDNAYWKITKTRKGHLIQAPSDHFEGWYLDLEETMKPVLPDHVVETDRYLVLASKARESSYWKLTETSHGYLFQAVAGPFKGWYLDLAAFDGSQQAPGRKFAQNLLIAEGVQLPWRLTQTERGYTIQATPEEYAGWYLGFDDDVKPEERSKFK